MKPRATRNTRLLIAILASSFCLLLAAPLRAGEVTGVEGEWIWIDRGANDSVAKGARVALTAPGKPPAKTEAEADAILVIERVEPNRAVGRLMRSSTGAAPAAGWNAFILSQDLEPRGVFVKVIVDDKALQVEKDRPRGCAGKRKSLRLESAEQATAQISQSVNEVVAQEGAQVQVVAPAPEKPAALPTPAPEAAAPAATPPPAAPAPGEPSPRIPPPQPAEPAAPAEPGRHVAVALPSIEYEASPALIVRIVYSGGQRPDEVNADIFIIGAGGETLERQTVKAAMASQTVRQMLARYIRSERGRQTVLNLHNPQPGFDIELWLNVPGGPSAASASSIAEAPKSAQRGISVGTADCVQEVEIGQSAVLRRGDRMTFGFRSARDCYLVLYNVGPEGEITQLLPNAYLHDNFIRANQTYMIPPPDKRTVDGKQVYFYVDAAKAVGMETVKAIATLDPMPLTAADIQEIEKGELPSVTPEPPSAKPNWNLAANSLANRMALTRGITSTRTRSISVGSESGAAPQASEPAPPPEIQKTMEEIRAYLRNLSRWSDATITFFTTD